MDGRYRSRPDIVRQRGMKNRTPWKPRMRHEQSAIPPIELEIKKSLSELLISCWAKIAAGGIVGAVHFGAKGGGPV
jgi:hypothetical protein